MTVSCLCSGGWRCCCFAHLDRHCLNVMGHLDPGGGGDTGVTRGPANNCQKFFIADSKDSAQVHRVE